ncbi:Carotenoid oxygenase [Parasponia andersonii]|uniref:Carotenoid oxygenase n=1 Tax=Parasponia andersonii TaxID=3476 RepID=A0A2P5D3C6_PARAD|nr:Carotenoid oxygenase [Parasponia andersonii]
MAASSFVLLVKGPVHRDSNSISQGVKRHKLKPSLSLNVNKPFLKELRQLPSMKVEFYEAIKITYDKMLDALADSIFKFVDQPVLPSQKNFVPVEEIGDIVEVTCSQGNIPSDFPQGVYIRNGPNPLFGGNKSTVSIFGQSSHTWVEGEGMVHAVYFKKLDDKLGHNWSISYKNRYVQSQTFKLEKQRNRPCFIPALEGDSTAIMAAFFVNTLRFGNVNKHMRNTNVIEHSGKIYVTAENHLPQEIDIHTLESFHEWDVDGAWDRTFTTHPKKAPDSGELVIMGVDAAKPYYVLGVISADGKKLLHKVDLKFNRSVLLHDIGVSQKYNVIMDYPLVVDAKRLIKGGPLVKFEKEGYARIGVMPRYGDAESVQWFEVQNHCTFHVINCFEEGNEVIVRGCRALESVLPGPDCGRDKYEWFSKGFRFTKDPSSSTSTSTEEGFLFSRAYEWRLNMVNGGVEERFLTGTDFSMDFPFINEAFTGLKHKYGYTQVVDSMASSTCGKAKYGCLAKLHFDEEYCRHSGKPSGRTIEKLVKIEYHKLEDNNFCSGSVFVPKQGAIEEDDGWVVSFVHNEETDITQVHVIDSKNFESKPIAKITLPQRVPYGFHGTFVSLPTQR